MARLTPSWMMLTEAFRLSLRPQCIGFSLVGLLATTLLWQAVGRVLLPPDNEQAQQFHDAVTLWPVQADAQYSVVRYLPAALRPPPRGQAWLPLDAAVGVPSRMIEPFRRVVLGELRWRSLLYYLAGGLLTVLVWSYCGVAVSRTAVVACGLRHQLNIWDAIGFGRQRGWVVFASALLPLGGIVLLALPFALLGLLLRLDVGVLLAGLLWAFVLLAGLLMAILSLGLLVGWPLLWGAVASENSDAFDAISRSYAYTFQRPFHYLWYAGVAAALAILGWLLAWCFSEAIIHMSFWAVGHGSGADRLEALRSAVNGEAISAPTGMMSAGVLLLKFHVGLLRCAASAHAFAFFWSATSVIYLLLRRDTDETDFDEIVAESVGPSQELEDG